MSKAKYDQTKGWYLDLNDNGDICWFNLDTGEQGECVRARDGVSDFSDDFDPLERCDNCEYADDCQTAGCGCIAP